VTKISPSLKLAMTSPNCIPFLALHLAAEDIYRHVFTFMESVICQKEPHNFQVWFKNSVG